MERPFRNWMGLFLYIPDPSGGDALELRLADAVLQWRLAHITERLWWKPEPGVLANHVTANAVMVSILRLEIGQLVSGEFLSPTSIGKWRWGQTDRRPTEARSGIPLQ